MKQAKALRAAFDKGVAEERDTMHAANCRNFHEVVTPISSEQEGKNEGE